MSSIPPYSPSPGDAKASLRVLVVDDQALIRRGMSLMLEAEPDIDVVGQAADGEEALRLALRLRPDVVLMDLNMPRVGGVAATRRILAELPATRVMVLTTFDSDDLVFDAIRAGACAYLLKDASEEEVVATVRAVHRGESRMTPAIARKVMDQFRLLANAAPPLAEGHAPTGPLPDGGAEATLSPKEEKILRLIAEGLSNREIAGKVFLAEGTVKNYVSRIMEKLQARTRTELAVLALRARHLP